MSIKLELKHGQGVIIDWVDSKALMGWTYDAKKPREPGHIRSLGFIVQVNEKCVTITTSLDDKGASMDDLSIPIGCVESFEVLPEKFRGGTSATKAV
jgi:hypothetical protein